MTHKKHRRGIPRRGEVGLNTDQIEAFEELGYVRGRILQASQQSFDPNLHEIGVPPLHRYLQSYIEILEVPKHP